MLVIKVKRSTVKVARIGTLQCSSLVSFFAEIVHSVLYRLDKSCTKPIVAFDLALLVRIFKSKKNIHMWCCSCDLVSNDYSFSSGFNCSLVSALPSMSLVDDWHVEDRVPILPQRLVSSTSFISLPTPRSTMDALIQLSTRLPGCWSDLERRSCLRNFQNSRPENEGPNSAGRKCGKELRSHIFRARILHHVPKTRLFSFQTHGFVMLGLDLLLGSSR